MARSPTTSDAFNAVAEPRRRHILDLLAQGERPVNDLVGSLGLAQPLVSKHLRVLSEVFLHRAMGWILPEHRDGLPKGWEHWLERIRDLAERKNRKDIQR